MELGELCKYLDKNLKKRFIRKSQSSAGNPILFIPKKNRSLRLCVDYWKLNNITVKNRYPLPNISKLQDQLSGAQWFTKLDLRGAYNLIWIKPGEEWKIAFQTRYGLYKSMVMPFGLTNAPATCQEVINNALREYFDIFVIAYLDNILIYSYTMDNHVQHLKLVLDCLQRKNLLIKPEKCDFHKQKVFYLGFLIGRDGMSIDPEKLRAVKDWERPTNVKEVWSFLGFIIYNRKFIEGYSKKALPLTNLTIEKNPWQ